MFLLHLNYKRNIEITKIFRHNKCRDNLLINVFMIIFHSLLEMTMLYLVETRGAQSTGSCTFYHNALET